MRRLLKSFTAFSVIAMLLFSFCISVGAVEETHNSQDGLVASITTKKDSYQSNEDIDLTFKVTNTNDFDVENVSLEAIIPDGLTLKKGDNTSINTVSLASGESLELTLTVVKESSVIVVPIETTNPNTEQPTETKPLSTENTTTVQTESVQATTTKANSAVSTASDFNNTNGSDNSSVKTGNNTNYILIGLICLISLAVAALAFRFRNKAVKYLSLALCVCISVSSIAVVGVTNTMAQETNQEMSFDVSKTITVEGREYEISANVKYKNSHASPNIDFGYLHCEPSTCNVGERTNVTFFIDLSNNDISKDDKIKLFVEEKFIGELNDNGENGDVTPNDKIYSATFSMFSNERKWAGYYVVINNQKSNTESLQFYKRATDEDLLFIDNFYKVIDDIKSNYVINKSDENKAIYEMQQYYNEVTSYLDKRSDVLDYCFTGFNIMVNFDNGLTAGIPFEDLTSDVDDNKKRTKRSLNIDSYSNINNTYKSEIITLEPYASSIHAPEFDNAATTIANTNKNYIFSTNLDNQEITFESMKKLSRYGMIILNSHGGNFDDKDIYGNRYGYVISLSDEVTPEKDEKYKNSDDLWKTIIPNGGYNGGNYVITEQFFEKYYNNTDFENSIIYFGTCHGGDDNVRIRRILKDKGSEAVLTYKNEVITTYNRKMIYDISEKLSKGHTISESVNEAKKKNGEYDPYISSKNYNELDFLEKVWYSLGLYNNTNPAELILDGNNTSFKLITNPTLEQIKGQVIDSNTKLPVSGVKISCDKIGVSCTTDKMGKFSFNIPVLDTQYEFVFSYNGYYNTTVVLSNYPELDTIELTPKKGSISANIISSNNTPLSKVRVDAYLKEEADLEYVGNTYTDDNGNFTMELQSGSYELRFNKDGYKTATTTVKISKDVMTVLKDPIVMETNVDWKQLYIDYINKTNSVYDYSLIYVNGDDIPELCLTGKYTMAGDILCWINNGSVQEETALGNYGTSYIEKEGLLLNTGGRQGTYFDKVFSFNGKNLELKIDGKSQEVLDDNSTYDFIYYINGDKVTKAEYNNKIDSIFDKSKSIKVSNKTYSKEEIIEIIKNM